MCSVYHGRNQHSVSISDKGTIDSCLAAHPIWCLPAYHTLTDQDRSILDLLLTTEAAKALQDRANRGGVLAAWIVSEDADTGGVVARLHSSRHDGPLPGVLVAPTLADLRAQLPAGLEAATTASSAARGDLGRMFRPGGPRGVVA